MKRKIGWAEQDVKQKKGGGAKSSHHSCSTLCPADSQMIPDLFLYSCPRPRPCVFPAFCATEHDVKAKRIPPSGLPLFFLASVFPLFASFLLLLRRVYSSFLSVAWKVHRKEWAPSGGRRRRLGRERGAPQLLFAVRKRYHLPTYTEEGGAEKGVTMVVRL